MTKSIFLLLFVGMHVYAISQTVKNPFSVPDFVKFAGKVEIIDSQYCLILTMNIEGDSSVRVKKFRWFNSQSIGSAQMQIRKIIRGHSVVLVSLALSQPPFHLMGEEEIINSSRPLRDTVYLDNEVPLELGGDYLVDVQLDINVGTESYIAQVQNVPFKISFLPPKSIYK